MRTGAITITDSAPNNPQTVGLSGVGDDPEVSLSATTLSFGNQMVGTRSAPQAVVLTNTGTATLRVNSVGISAQFVKSGNCPGSIDIGKSCTVNVIFAPTTTGPIQGTLTLSDDAPGSPQTVSLTGTGVAAPVAESGTHVGRAPSQLP
jgi:hypothetical protein